MRLHSIGVPRGRASRITKVIALFLVLGTGCSDAEPDRPKDAPPGPGSQVAQIARTSDGTTGHRDAPATEARTDETGPSQPTAEQAAQQPGRVDGKVAPGESLSRMLHDVGLAGREIHEVTLALSAVMDPEVLHVGQKYTISLRMDGTLESLTLALTPLVEVRIERDEEGKLEANKLEREPEIRIEEIGGTVERSLSAAITAHGEHPSLVDFFVDVFEYDINFFTDTRAGDVFKIVVEKQLLDDEFIGYRHVLAAEYAGKIGTLQAFWWDPKNDGRGRYVDALGRGVARTLLKTPLKYTHVSSEFDRQRMHPVLHRVKGHYGTDYAAPTGTPVRAAASGTIRFRDRKKGAGNLVIIAHGDGLQTLYMHLERFEPGQAVGQHVRQKTVIGYVGSTGLATGPHLHFGVKIGGRYVDPQKVKMKRGPGVSRTERRRFRRHVAELGTRLAAIPSN